MWKYIDKGGIIQLSYKSNNLTQWLLTFIYVINDTFLRNFRRLLLYLAMVYYSLENY